MIPSHHLRYNRSYHCRKRDETFRQVIARCRKFRSRQWNSTADDETVALLLELEEAIALCIDHSRAALFGHRRGELPSYGANPKGGILQEELLLLRILEEKHRSVEFVKTYLRTERELDRYLASLEQQKAPGEGSGFLDQMIRHIEEIRALSDREIAALVKIQGERSDLGESLLDRVRSLLPSDPK